MAKYNYFNKYNKRIRIKKLLLNYKKILEIGPFTNPFIWGDNVKYFDILPIEILLEKASKEKFLINNPPKEIHYCSPVGDLNIVNEKFDAVFSSHCIEHVYDFIGHLQDMSKILTQDGKYFLFIPDKRFTMDHYKEETTIFQLLERFYSDKQPSLNSLIIDRTLTTHNWSYIHWLGIHGKVNFDVSKIKSAVDEFKELSANHEHLDIHFSFFTPHGFLSIMKSLYQLGYINLIPEYISDCDPGFCEFCVILRKHSEGNFDWSSVGVASNKKIKKYFLFLLSLYEKPLKESLNEIKKNYM